MLLFGARSFPKTGAYFSGSCPLQPQHIEHVVEPRRFAADPQRRLQRAAREDHAVRRLVGEFDALVGAGEDHAVLARDIAAAQAGEADRSRLARAGVAVAATLALLL